MANNKVDISKETVSLNEYFTLFGNPGTIENHRARIWDNLICFTVLNSYPKLREQLMQIIIADFCLQETEGIKERVLARVVIPKVLFGIGLEDEPEENDEELTRKISQTDIRNHEINLEQAHAKTRIKQLENGFCELKNIEKNWNKTNKKSYEEAKATHDGIVENLMAEAETATSTNPVTGETTTYFVNLDLPKFIFNPQPQISLEALEGKLSEETLFVFHEIGLFENDNSFADAYTAIQENLNLFTQTLQSNFVANESVTVMGNTVVHSTESTFSATYSFMCMFVKVASEKFKLMLTANTPNIGKMPVEVECTIAIQGGASFTTNLSGPSSLCSNSHVLIHFFENTPIILPLNSIVSASGKLIFSDGTILKFGPTLNKTITNIGIGDMISQSGMSEVTQITTTPTASSKTFGIQRLGIADYRRVEQTVCGYVPGEVSHIENIMAKEYKERSTRRLRKSEETTTNERQTEKENITDTATSDRYEMQSEVSNIIQEDTQKALSVNTSFSTIGAAININASYANNVSQQQSNSQAVSYAKDVTIRAVERVVTKVREERVLKIVEEFEEKNAHGFDNRGGTVHISGVYRWIDKIYRNKILNYGKRLMYEFAIPEPARFHFEAIKSKTNSGITTLQKPIDPRSAEAGANKITNHNDITRSNYAYWAGVYNATVEAPPEYQKYVGANFSETQYGGNELYAESKDITIPKGYYTVSCKIIFSTKVDWDNTQGHSILVSVGNSMISLVAKPHDLDINYSSNNTTYSLAKFTDKIETSVSTLNYLSSNFAISILLQLTDEAENNWKINTFNAIIAAYEAKNKKYEDALADAKIQSVNNTINPAFYRQIENTVLKKTCISYMEGLINMGRDLYTGDNLKVLDVVRNAEMDDYTSRVRFIEQAFEWDIMSYNFYPFYWGTKNNWATAYQTECDDALFRSFLQAGLARVVVSVRPGFEEAAMYYIATGKVWNGGQVPTIGDDMYLSVIDELKNPIFEVEETWNSRIPSTLTVIQDGTVGLAASGLPYNCEEGLNTGLSGREEVMGVVLPSTQ